MKKIGRWNYYSFGIDEILEQFHLEKEKRNTDFKSILNEELFMNVYSIYFLNAFMKT